jgi:hypothetical protein
MTVIEYLTKRENALTPDFKAALNTLHHAMPEASLAELVVLLQDRFPDIYKKTGRFFRRSTSSQTIYARCGRAWKRSA